MYGHIHKCIRGYVLKVYGEEMWEKVLEQSGCNEFEEFSMFSSYPDDVTMTLTMAVIQVCDTSLEEMLEGTGELFLTFCCQSGYDKMLRTLGDNIVSFIQNLDPLHETLSMTYTELKAPSFRCEVVGDNKLELHYYSYRENLYPMVIGILKSVARDLFNTEISLKVKSRETIGKDIKHRNEHVVFEVIVDEKVLQQSKRTNSQVIEYNETLLCQVNSKSSDTKFTQHDNCYSTELNDQIIEENITLLGSVNGTNNEKHTQPNNSYCTGLSKTINGFSTEDFCHLLPFHIMFDNELNVLSYGEKLSEISCLRKSPNATSHFKISDLVNLLYPYIEFDYNHMMEFINSKYILELTKSSSNSKLSLKGQMIYMKSTGNLIFIGSPLLKNLDDLQDNNIYISDIPMYDATRELILLSQQRITELEISKQLDLTTNELKKMANALAIEKKKTDELLYQMLPVKVANLLREGRHVEAEKFSDTTVLFGDIVGFTEIASIVQPIHIVRMLNGLYSIFDELTSKHSVYKVETIGDAYMVVGGVPEQTSDHAVRVAEFALEMVRDAGRVSSPASGKPIQMRIGLHSGPVVAGVVGNKMPRYCLFGDTVNTSSRMESHGQPNKIHCSHTTYSILSQDSKLTFQPRGYIEIKGKGSMRTYFVLNHTKDISAHQYMCTNATHGLESDTFADPSDSEHVCTRNCGGCGSCKQMKRVNLTTICGIL